MPAPARSGSAGEDVDPSNGYNSAQVMAHLAKQYGIFEHKLKDGSLNEERKPMLYIPKSESLAVANPPHFMVEMQKQFMEKHTTADFGAALGGLLGGM